MAKYEASESASSPQGVALPGSLSSGRLWTPWRMQYVVGDAKRDDCVFCSHLAEGHDSENLILSRGNHAFVIMNLYPYNTGHLMIIPNNHVASPENLGAAELLEMATLRNAMLRAIRMALAPGGFNIGLNLGDAAGAGIATHLHEHIVPRWLGDANFMPIVGGTKVLPELLPTTYAKLRAELERKSETIEAPVVILSSDETSVLVNDNGSAPRIHVNSGTPVWRALSNEALARGIRGLEILGWGGMTDGQNSSPIIVHRISAPDSAQQEPSGRWLSFDKALPGPDGPLFEKIRCWIDFSDDDSTSL